MSDDQLQARYNAQVARNAPTDRAACPSPEQLERLADGGNGHGASNLTLLDHVFGCAYCRPEFALLRSVQTTAESADRGSAARTKAATRWFTAPRLAVAAVVLVAIGIGGNALRHPRDDMRANVLRNAPGAASDVVTVSPLVNDLFAVDAQFVWRKVSGAVTYEIQLLDTTGVVIMTHVTADTVFSPAAEDRAKLAAAKIFDWFVAARRSDGNERQSNIARVRVRTTERR
ncbi:MAG: hypothetical protein ABI120_08840 [Gemmatimonadaceae bacterium]